MSLPSSNRGSRLPSPKMNQSASPDSALSRHPSSMPISPAVGHSTLPSITGTRAATPVSASADALPSPLSPPMGVGARVSSANAARVAPRGDARKAIVDAILTDNVGNLKRELERSVGLQDLDTVLNTNLNEEGWQTAHFCAANDCFHVLGWALDHGANLAAQSVDTLWTPMHLAAYNNTERCSALMRNCNAPLGLRDQYGDRACDIARTLGHDAIAELFGDDMEAREKRRQEEEKEQALIREAKALEAERELIQKKEEEEQRLAEERKQRRKDRIVRQKKLKYVLEGERVELLLHWWQQRQTTEREVIHQLEWQGWSWIHSTFQLEKYLILIKTPPPSVSLPAVMDDKRKKKGRRRGSSGIRRPSLPSPLSRKGSLKRRSSSLTSPSGDKPPRPVGTPDSGSGAGTPKSPALPLRRSSAAGSRRSSVASASGAPPLLPPISRSGSADRRSSTASSVMPTQQSPPPAQSPPKRRKGTLHLEDWEYLIPEDLEGEITVPAPRGLMTKAKRAEMNKIRNMLEEERRRRVHEQNMARESFLRQCIQEQDDEMDMENKARKEIIVDFLIGLGEMASKDPTVDRVHSGVFERVDAPDGAGLRSNLDISPSFVGFGGGEESMAPSESMGQPMHQKRAPRASTVTLAPDQSLVRVPGSIFMPEPDPFEEALAVKLQWSCCKQRDFIVPGCVAAEDPLKPMHHRGSYGYHLPDCTCGRMSTAKGLRYCNPGGFIWSCCGAMMEDADGCTRHRRFLYAANTCLEQKFSPFPEAALELLTEAFNAAQPSAASAPISDSPQVDPLRTDSRGRRSSHVSTVASLSHSRRTAPLGGDAALEAKAVESEGTHTPRETPEASIHPPGTESDAAPTMSTSMLRHTLPSFRGSLRRSTSIRLRLDPEALKASNQGRFAQSSVPAKFSELSSPAVRVSDSGNIVTHRVKVPERSRVTRTNIFGHFQMDPSHYDDNVFAFEVLVQKCAVPSSVTEERMVIGLVLADLPAGYEATNASEDESDDGTNSSDDGGNDHRNMFRVGSGLHGGTRTPSPKGKKGKPLPQWSDQKPTDSGTRVELGEDSPSAIASRLMETKELTGSEFITDEEALSISKGSVALTASRGCSPVAAGSPSFGTLASSAQVQALASSQTTTGIMALHKSAPDTVEAALEGQFISGKLGIGWWSHSPQIRGLGVSTEASASFKEGDMIGIVVDGLNNGIIFFLNREPVAIISCDVRRPLRPAITMVAGSAIVCDCGYRRSSLQYAETFMRERALAERAYRLKHYGTMHAYAGYAKAFKVEGWRRRWTLGAGNAEASRAEDSDLDDELDSKIMF